MRAHTFVLPLAVALSVAGCKRDTTQAAGDAGTAGTGSGPASTMAASPATPAGGGYGTSGTTGATGATAATGATGTTSAMTGAPFTAEVVTVERDGSGITLREVGAMAAAKASRRMVSVDPASASSVSGLKKGDRVTVTCTETGGMSGMSGMSGSGTTGATSATGTGSLQACTTVVSVMPAGR